MPPGKQASLQVAVFRKDFLLGGGTASGSRYEQRRMNWISKHTLLPADAWLLVLACLGAMCIGMSKAGLSGTSTLNVVLMAKIFGAKESVGVILPMLIAADYMGYFINRKGGSWRLRQPCGFGSSSSYSHILSLKKTTYSIIVVPY